MPEIKIINCRHIGAKRLSELIENADAKTKGGVAALSRALRISDKTNRDRVLKIARHSLSNVREWDADIREREAKREAEKAET